MTVFVEFEGEILPLKRSSRARTYQGLWNTAVDYIDEERSIQEIVMKEPHEELGVSRSKINLASDC